MVAANIRSSKQRRARIRRSCRGRMRRGPLRVVLIAAAHEDVMGPLRRATARGVVSRANLSKHLSQIVSRDEERLRRRSARAPRGQCHKSGGGIVTPDAVGRVDEPNQGLPGSDNSED